MRSSKKFLKYPVRPFEVKNPINIIDAVRRMKHTSFQGRSLGTALEIWEEMLRARATIFMGLAGAMVPAGMKKVVSFLIKNRFIDCLVSTGANLFHDVVESLGIRHYRGTHNVDDTELLRNGIDRIYDTFASEGEFRRTDDWIMEFSEGLDTYRPYTTREFLYLLGGRLCAVGGKDGILVSAHRAGVPIYCPALGDSSIGIALAAARCKNGSGIQFDIIKDVIETTRIAAEAGATGVIYIGGGAPKNFIQQTEVTASIVGKNVEGHKYAIQITQDSPQWGGLSGCTFEEAQSWGKIAKKASMVTVHADATIALPIIASALASRMPLVRKRSRPSFLISGEDLKIIKTKRRNLS